ncbi:MAG: baseplate J/gp47 family protein [Phascolarctobacterium sp.]
MKSIKSLPEIVFVDADAKAVETTIISEYQTITGRTLAKGDPVRLFLLTIANIIILLLNQINETGKQNLLRYATGDNLDHLGALVGAERVPAVAAITTIKVSLSTKLGTSTLIPAGTRFTAGDNVFFALQDTMIIPAGELVGTGLAVCLDTGAIGNGYVPGQIKTLVDPLPYVASIENTTLSEGGADEQDDESYRDVIHTAPESFSVAGPDGAYEYHAKKAAANIIDVYVGSPEAGTVEIRPLLEDGVIPGEELLNIVKTALDNRRVRPLTDNVIVLAPTKKEYTVNITYYIDIEDETQATAIQNAVTKAVAEFEAWQRAKLGRDINPSELIARVMAAGAKRANVVAPSFISVDGTEVAYCTSTIVNLGGIEDA